MFLAAVPIAAVTFGPSWLLREVPLRATSTATNPADTPAPTSIPASCTSLGEISRALSVLAGSQLRGKVYQRLAARAGHGLDPPATWILLRIHDHPGDDLAARAMRAGL